MHGFSASLEDGSLPLRKPTKRTKSTSESGDYTQVKNLFSVLADREDDPDDTNQTMERNPLQLSGETADDELTSMEHSEVNKTVDLTEDDPEVIQLDDDSSPQTSRDTPQLDSEEDNHLSSLSHKCD